MKFLRLVFYRIFGLKKYLRIVSSVYIKYIDNGFGKDKYPEIHYLKSLIKPGFTCIDIGANLGYYSYFLAKLVGVTGKVYAVEPIPVFVEVWQKNLSKYKSPKLVLYPYALGEAEKLVKMGMPEVDGVVHHGMTRVINEGETGFEKMFDVEMKNPDFLFGEIEKIDFIKVDVEGYERVVFENMQQVLLKHHPMIQSELSGTENRLTTIKILENIGYVAHVYKDRDLIIADQKIIDNHNGDFYFLFSKN
jgi:FkbM family methyltransferase